MEALVIEQLKAQLQDLLGNGKLKQAIHLMEEQLPNNSQAYIDLLKQKAAFKKLESEKNDHVISSDQYAARHSKIVKSMLNLTMVLSENINIPAQIESINESSLNPNTIVQQAEENELMYKIIGGVVLALLAFFFFNFLYNQFFTS